MNNDNDNDQGHFTFDEKQAKKIIRKAKFWSSIKIIGITVIITPILLIALWYGNRSLSTHNAQKAMNHMVLFNDISAPNVQISNQSFDTNQFGGGKIKLQTYKVVGDRPYIWEPIEARYNLFGKHSGNYDLYGAIRLEGSSSLKKSNQFERFNAFTGDREMFFSHPEIKYDVYQDSISELTKFDPSTVVEMGLSFDQAYPFDEIKSKLPSDVKPTWWWVDTFTEEKVKYLEPMQGTISADSPFMFGFQAEHSKPKFQQSESDSFDEVQSSFIEKVERLRKEKDVDWELKQAYKAMSGENETLEKDDVKIIGAVVTGTAEQLKALANQPYIKASTFGVITDRK